MRPLDLGALGFALNVGALRQIEMASQEDVLAYADGFTVSNFIPTRTLDMATAGPAEIGHFLATLISDCKRRGPNRLEPT